MTVVMKFGGTSVGGAEAMGRAADLVERALPDAPLVVLSAMSGATNALFEAAKKAESGDAAGSRTIQKELVAQHHACARAIFDGNVPEQLATQLREHFEELRVLLTGVYLLRELTPRNMDHIASTGEQLSTRLFTAFLAHRGVDATWVDARALIRTDRRFGSARPSKDAIAALAKDKLVPQLGAGRAVVTQGYIGSTEDGLTTTLGRGGSDFSAALFGAALRAREVQIWTDVEGILTCDPRVVPEAETIPQVAFAEAAELAAFGAKVLHPATIQPAVEANIPVTVRHTAKPDGGYTLIQAEVTRTRAVTALASRGPVTVLTVHSTRMLAQSGFLARLFEVFGRLGVSVDLIATAEISVSMTIEPGAPIAELTEEISRFAEVEVANDRAIVAIVGASFRDTPGIARRVFGALAELNVEMISMGANEINLSLVVRRDRANDALRLLHKEFFEKDRPGARP
ncbi:MAG: lysine-sensitive aspartokinase 3 [Planctomycetota bacterium]